MLVAWVGLILPRGLLHCLGMKSHCTNFFTHNISEINCISQILFRFHYNKIRRLYQIMLLEMCIIWSCSSSYRLYVKIYFPALHIELTKQHWKKLHSIRSSILTLPGGFLGKGILVGPARWFGALLVDPARNCSSSPGTDSGPEFCPDSGDGGEKCPS